MSGEPLMHGINAVFCQATRPLGSVNAANDKASFFEDLQVLRDGRLGHFEWRGGSGKKFSGIGNAAAGWQTTISSVEGRKECKSEK